ncbi:MAG: hypothetical protein ACKVP0_15785 [Pirellulaceae bacterium]
MNTNDFGNSTQLWLDRLACGELDEKTRKSLFTWLEAEPLRWRGCALALLEAQTWNESLAGVTQAEGQETCGRELRRGRETRAEQRWWVPLASLAAAVLIAFSLGALSRGWLAPQANAVVENKPSTEKQAVEKEPVGPLMATVSLRHDASQQIPATLQIPVMSVKDSLAQPAASPISDYDRQKWERRGYQLIKERRYLPAELPGGKKVIVPVEQVKASYVGSKVS